MTSPVMEKAISALTHPQMGPLDLEFTSFAVEGRPDSFPAGL
ncbi:transcriptional regulator [Klebsiella pneumoniae]|nr:transcriptional regulator [Klebsiella pneumoniae]